MNSLEIIDLLINQKFAKNRWQAGNIMRGLKLWELEDEKSILERTRLYRDLRKSGVYGNATAACFEKAVDGVQVPLLPEINEKEKPDEEKGD